MTETDTLQFLLTRDYVAEEFGDIFSPQDDMDRDLTPTESQKLGLLLLADLPEQHEQFTHAVISPRGEKLLVTLTRS